MKKNLNFYLQLSFTILVCAFLIIPVIMSITAGVTENYFMGLSSGLTLRWIKEVLSLYMETIYLSMYIALSTLVVTLILGVPSAYVLATKQNRLTRIIEELLVLPIAIPGLAIALALIITYGGIKDFRTSWLFILVGHVLYTLPFMLRSVLSVLHSIDFKKLEEGAYSLGAGFWRSFFTIILPNCKSGILAGSLMVLTLSIGEFNLTWMLHTPLTKTLPVGLADSYASMRLEIGSAYTLIFLLMILPLLIALQTLGGFGEKKTERTKEKNYKLNNGIENG
jgi:putative spermidine/putrescine transport system permease protein